MIQIAIVTMAYNERVNLPIWVRHYTRHCPGATLFVLDHGSDDGSTEGLAGVSVVPLPRTPFDDQTRVEIVADFQHALLRVYDVVIYTDSDEMLVADPRRHASLATFLAAVGSDVIAPVGLNVHHMRDIEAAIDLNAPILGQRRHVRYGSGACKPTIARVPLHWVPGFHWCDRVPDYRTDLYHFHLRRMDFALSMERLRFTRAMVWSERALRHNWGRRQRQSDDERIRDSFENPEENFRVNSLAPFEFEAVTKRTLDSLRLSDGFYVGDYLGSPIIEVPDAFFGLI